MKRIFVWSAEWPQGRMHLFLVGIEFYVLIICRNCKHKSIQCITVNMTSLYAFGNKNIHLKTNFNFKYTLNYNNYKLKGTYIKKKFKQICLLNYMSYTCNFFLNFKEIGIIKVSQKLIKLFSIICVICRVNIRIRTLITSELQCSRYKITVVHLN